MNQSQPGHAYRKNLNYKGVTAVKKQLVENCIEVVYVHSFTLCGTLLAVKHTKDYLKFVKDHLDKGIEFWELVVLSNESKIVLFSRNESHLGGNQGWPTQLKIIGGELMIYRRSWPIEAMMGMR